MNESDPVTVEEPFVEIISEDSAGDASSLDVGEEVISQQLTSQAIDESSETVTDTTSSTLEHEQVDGLEAIESPISDDHFRTTDEPHPSSAEELQDVDASVEDNGDDAVQTGGDSAPTSVEQSEPLFEGIQQNEKERSTAQGVQGHTDDSDDVAIKDDCPGPVSTLESEEGDNTQPSVLDSQIDAPETEKKASEESDERTLSPVKVDDLDTAHEGVHPETPNPNLEKDDVGSESICEAEVGALEVDAPPSVVDGDIAAETHETVGSEGDDNLEVVYSDFIEGDQSKDNFGEASEHPETSLKDDLAVVTTEKSSSADCEDKSTSGAIAEQLESPESRQSQDAHENLIIDCPHDSLEESVAVQAEDTALISAEEPGNITAPPPTTNASEEIDFDSTAICFFESADDQAVQDTNGPLHSVDEPIETIHHEIKERGDEAVLERSVAISTDRANHDKTISEVDDSLLKSQTETIDVQTEQATAVNSPTVVPSQVISETDKGVCKLSVSSEQHEEDMPSGSQNLEVITAKDEHETRTEKPPADTQQGDLDVEETVPDTSTASILQDEQSLPDVMVPEFVNLEEEQTTSKALSSAETQRAESHTEETLLEVSQVLNDQEKESTGTEEPVPSMEDIEVKELKPNVDQSELTISEIKAEQQSPCGGTESHSSQSIDNVATPNDSDRILKTSDPPQMDVDWDNALPAVDVRPQVTEDIRDIDPSGSTSLEKNAQDPESERMAGCDSIGTAENLSLPTSDDNSPAKGETSLTTVDEDLVQHSEALGEHTEDSQHLSLQTSNNDLHEDKPVEDGHVESPPMHSVPDHIDKEQASIELSSEIDEQNQDGTCEEEVRSNDSADDQSSPDPPPVKIDQQSTSDLDAEDKTIGLPDSLPDHNTKADAEVKLDDSANLSGDVPAIDDRVPQEDSSMDIQATTPPAARAETPKKSNHAIEQEAVTVQAEEAPVLPEISVTASAKESIADVVRVEQETPEPMDGSTPVETSPTSDESVPIGESTLIDQPSAKSNSVTAEVEPVLVATPEGTVLEPMGELYHSSDDTSVPANSAIDIVAKESATSEQEPSGSIEAPMSQPEPIPIEEPLQADSVEATTEKAGEDVKVKPIQQSESVEVEQSKDGDQGQPSGNAILEQREQLSSDNAIEPVSPTSPSSHKKRHRSSRHSSHRHSSLRDLPFAPQPIQEEPLVTIRKRRDSESGTSFKAFLSGLTGNKPTTPPPVPKPLRVDSGIDTGSTSSHGKHRRRVNAGDVKDQVVETRLIEAEQPKRNSRGRTVEEQEAHDKRKAERQASRALNDEKAEGTVQSPLLPPDSIPPNPRRLSSRRHSVSRSHGSGSKSKDESARSGRTQREKESVVQVPTFLASNVAMVKETQEVLPKPRPSGVEHPTPTNEFSQPAPDGKAKKGPNYRDEHPRLDDRTRRSSRRHTSSSQSHPPRPDQERARDDQERRSKAAAGQLDKDKEARRIRRDEEKKLAIERAKVEEEARLAKEKDDEERAVRRAERRRKRAEEEQRIQEQERLDTEKRKGEEQARSRGAEKVIAFDVPKEKRGNRSDKGDMARRAEKESRRDKDRGNEVPRERGERVHRNSERRNKELDREREKERSKGGFSSLWSSAKKAFA